MTNPWQDIAAATRRMRDVARERDGLPWSLSCMVAVTALSRYWLDEIEEQFGPERRAEVEHAAGMCHAAIAANCGQ